MSETSTTGTAVLPPGRVEEIYLPRHLYEQLVGHARRKLDGRYEPGEEQAPKAYGLVGGRLLSGGGGTIGIEVSHVFPLLRNLRDSERYKPYVDQLMEEVAIRSETPMDRRGWVTDPREVAQIEAELDRCDAVLLGGYHMHRLAWAHDPLRDTCTELDTCLAEGSGMWMLILSMVDPERPVLRAFFEGDNDREVPIRLGVAAELTGPSPAATVRSLIAASWLSRAVAVAVELGIPDLLAVGPRTAGTLAAAVGADERSLARLLSALTGSGVVQRLPDGRFALGPLGGVLREDVPGSMAGYARAFGGDRAWSTWGALAHSVRTGQNAHEHLFRATWYEHLASDPAAAKDFDRAMAGSIAGVAAAVVAAYDFSGLACLLDVGGGDGTLLAAVLSANPSLRGVLFETPAVAEGGRARLGSFAERCEVVAGDFLEQVPAGADAYLLCRVLRSLDDAGAGAVLRNCAAAMEPGARLLAVERLGAADGSAPTHLGDLNMLVLTGGRDRTLEEHTGLLAAAGLRVERVVPTKSEMSVIEARRGGDAG